MLLQLRSPAAMTAGAASGNAAAVTSAAGLALGVVALAAAVRRQRRARRAGIARRAEGGDFDAFRPLRDLFGGRESLLEDALTKQKEMNSEIEAKMQELEEREEKMKAELMQENAANTALRKNVEELQAKITAVQGSFDKLSSLVELTQIQRQIQLAKLSQELETSKGKAAKAAKDAEKSLQEAKQKLVASEQMNIRLAGAKDEMNIKLKRSAEELESMQEALAKETASLKEAEEAGLEYMKQVDAILSAHDMMA